MLKCGSKLHLSCSVSACKPLLPVPKPRSASNGRKATMCNVTSLRITRDLVYPSSSVLLCLGAVTQLPEHAKILGFRDEVRGDYTRAPGLQRIKFEMVGTHRMKETD